MRDFGRLGQGLAQRAKDASHQVAASVGEALESRVEGVEEEQDSAQAASAAEVNQEVGRLKALLDSRRPAPGPVSGRWSIGIGDLFAEHPKVPRQLHGVLRTLDHYGGLAITERSVAFDGEAIEWSAVTAIRTRNVVEYLLSDAVAQQISSLPLPWFPGRRKVLDALSKALLTLLLTTASQHLDRAQALRIPAEISYRGKLGREREMTPGLLAALALADPAVNQCLLATAAAHGIVVCDAADDTLTSADQRAVALRARLAVLQEKVLQWRGGEMPSTSD